ncbi:MAG: hypothetical protein R6U08_03070 [Bacillota bacterium]
MKNILNWRDLWRTVWGKVIIVTALLLIIAVVVILLSGLGQEPAGELENSGYKTLDGQMAQNSEAETEEDRRKVVELESGTITILKLQAGEGSTQLHLLLEEVPSLKVYEGESGNDNVRSQREKLDQLLKEIFLIDAQGREYIFEDGSYMISHTASSGSPEGSTWRTEVYLELPPLKDPDSELILVIPLSEEKETRLEVNGTLQ